MTDALKPAPDGVVISRELLAFLCGDGPLDGHYFGEKPDHERGNFWWRKHLRAAEQAGEPMAGREVCRECGSDALTWFAHNRNRSQVVEGRLRTNDVECIFVLGCDACSETLRTVPADEMAAQLTEAPLPTLQRLGQEFDAGEAEPVAWMIRKSGGDLGGIVTKEGKRLTDDERQRGWTETPLYAKLRAEAKAYEDGPYDRGWNFAVERCAEIAEDYEAAPQSRVAAGHWLEPYRSMDASGSPEAAGQVGHSWLIDIAREEHGNDPAALEIDMPRLTADGTAQILYRGPKVLAAAFIVRDPMNYSILFRYRATPQSRGQAFDGEGDIREAALISFVLRCSANNAAAIGNAKSQAIELLERFGIEPRAEGLFYHDIADDERDAAAALSSAKRGEA